MERTAFKSLLILLSVFTSFLGKAQLSGTVSVPGTYANLSLAINDINVQGVNGAFTVFVQAAYTETVPLGGFSLTATGASTAPIIFMKSGTGANPLLVAYSGGTATPASAVQDGIWRFVGCDYVTVDGIDLFDPNTTNPATMEYGYAFFKASTFNGCQNNTIQNCTVTLSSVNNASGSGPSVEGSRGINVVNALAIAQTSNLSPISTAGANSFNKFYGNKILNTNIGIALIGYSAPSPYTLADYNNEVGGLLAATGNTIENFGGAAAAANAAAGVRTLAQYNFQVANNRINNNNGTGVNHVNTLRGIFLNTAVSAISTVINNTITLNSAATTQTVAGIENLAGSTAASNTLTFQGNVITSSSFTTCTTGPFYGIYNNGATAAGLIISDNRFLNIQTISNTGNVQYILNNAAIAGPSTFTNNAVLNCSHSSTASSGFFGVWNNAAIAGDLTMSSNTFSNLVVQNTSGAINPLYNTGAASGQIVMNNNLFSAQQFSALGTGTMALLYNNAASAASLAINTNTVINSVLQNSTGAVHVLYNRGATTNTFNALSISSNSISQITYSSTSNGAFYSIWNNGVTATITAINANTVTGSNWFTTSSTRYMISNWGNSPQQSIQNNSISNCSGTVGTTGQLFGIYNNNPNAGSGATVSITGNTLSALNFSSTTGDLIFLMNQGVTTNTLAGVLISNNNLSAISTSISSSGGAFAIYNNSASAFTTAIVSNTIAQSNFIAANGVIFSIYNRGISAGFYGTVSIELNNVRNNSFSASAGSSMQFIQHLGAATTSVSLVSLSNNTFSNAVITATASSMIVLLNNGPVQGSLAINNNLISNITHTLNLTGQLVGIQNNAAVSGSMSITNNTVTVFNTMASTGSKYTIYNVSAISGAGEINNNLITASTHSASSNSALMQIFNAGGTGSVMAINGNTFSALSCTLQNGASYGIYHNSANSNTIATFSVNSNLLSNYVAYGVGSMFGIYRNLGTSVSANINNNRLLSVSLNSATNSKLFVANAGPVTGTLNISGNSLSAISASLNTTAFVYGIHNAANTDVVAITGNTLTNYFVSSTTGSVIALFNAASSASINSAATLSANTISQTTFSGTSTGYFSFIQNGSASTQSVYVNNNSISNNTVTTLTGVFNAICMRGVSSNTVHNLFVNTNTVSNIYYSSSTGSLSALFNNGYTFGNQYINANAISTIDMASASAARIYIFNACATNTLISITNNTISQITASFAPSINNAIISNTATSQGDILISGNRIFSVSVSSASSAINMLVNSGVASSSLQITSNAISQCTLAGQLSASICVLQNTAPSGSFIAISSNSISNLSVSTPSGNVFCLVNSRSGTLTSLAVSVASNVIANSLFQTGGGLLYAIYNQSVTAQRSRIESNSISSNAFLNTTNSVVTIYNNSSNSSSFRAVANTLTSNSISINAGLFESIMNVGVADSIIVQQNTIQTNTTTGTLLVQKCLHNAGNALTYLSISQNTLNGNSHALGGSGSHNYIINDGAAGGTVDINSNSFNSNQTVSFTGSVTLVENLVPFVGNVNINANELSYSFSTTANGYVGDFTGINVNGASATGSLSVSQNTFSSINFASGGNGAINYIKNADNPLQVLINGNVWLGLQINQAGAHTLIRNTAVQNSLSVSNNSIVGGYIVSSAGGGFAGYISGNGTTQQSSQTFLNNDFSAITATTSGFGSFYGIYSKDAAASKIISGNRLSAINYNSGGFMYGISADYLGNSTGTISSVVSSNTVGGITWQGPFFGVEVGPNISTFTPAVISNNAVISVTANAGVPDMFGMMLRSNAAGLVVGGNRVSGLREISSLGTCHGIYFDNSTTATLYNNLVSDLLAPATTLTESANGIRIVGAGNSQVFYNTVYMQGVGSGTVSGSNALYSSETGTLDLRNNILVNTQVPQGVGVSAALRRSGTSLSTFASQSDRNLLYAGIPSATSVLYAQGAAGYSLHTQYKSAVNPREINGITEDPVLLSTTPTASMFLHIDPTVNTLIESGAQNLIGMASDVDGQIRQGNTGYVGTGTAPDIGADEFETNLTACTGANSATIAAAGGTLFCEGSSAYLYATGYSTSGGISYQWKVASAAAGPYTNVISASGSTRPILITNTLSTGTYFFKLETTCSSGPVTLSSNIYSFAVNAVPGATAAINPSLVCSGNSVSLTCNSTAGASFVWLGPGNYSASISNPVIATGGSVGTGDYTVTSTFAGCTSSAVVNMSVNLTPPNFTLSPNSPSVCSGASISLAASLPITTPTLVGGAQASQNAGGAYPAPYSIYYGGQKMQFLIAAAELAASGFTTGTPITDISFPVVSLGAAWGTAVQDCQSFKLSLGTTTLGTLSQFINNLNVVVGPINYTPTIGYANTHVFIAPLVWDGTSNLIVETVFSNNLVGNGSMSVIHNIHNAGFNATQVYRADNASVPAVESATTGNVNVGLLRPDFRLNGQSIGTYSWSPNTYLNTTSAAAAISVPTSNIVYTVTLGNSNCITQRSVSIQVYNTPTISVTAGSSSVCIGNTVMLQASGATTYTWNTGVVAQSIAVSPQAGASYSVTGGNGFCPNVTAGTNLTILPPLTLSLAATSSIICSGQTTTLTATGAQTYTWSSGSNTGSTAVSPLTTTIYTITAESGPACRTIKSVNIKVNPLPQVLAVAAAGTVCPQQLVKLTGAGASQYTWQPGGQNGSQLNAYPNSTTTYTLFGKDLNGCIGSATVLLNVGDCTGIGSSEISSGIRVYPNPTNGLFTVRSASVENRTYTLYSADGKQIANFNSADSEVSFSIEGYARGLYILNVSSLSGIDFIKITLQ